MPTVRNTVKRFTAHGSKANVPGRSQKRKVDEQLQRKIVQMVDEDYGSTSKQIQADLQAQGLTCQLTLSVAIRIKRDTMVQEPGEPHC